MISISRGEFVREETWRADGGGARGATHRFFFLALASRNHPRVLLGLALLSPPSCAAIMLVCDFTRHARLSTATRTPCDKVGPNTNFSSCLTSFLRCVDSVYAAQCRPRLRIMLKRMPLGKLVRAMAQFDFDQLHMRLTHPKRFNPTSSNTDAAQHQANQRFADQ